jgi:hypothetical protein
MRRYLLLFGLLAAGLAAMAQSRGFNYQAVARDASGAVLASQAVNIGFLIRQGSAAGTVVYQETHAATTSALGLFSLEIGKGNTVTGNFDGINWGEGEYFLEVQINGASAGAQELLEVPFARVATDMPLAQLSDVDPAAPANGQVLKWNGTAWAPAGDNNTTYTGGTGISVAGTTISNTGDLSNTNEIQTLSISGTSISLSSGGGTVALPYSAGSGIALSAGGQISNTGDANAADDITTSTPAGGDLAGAYPNPTVDGLQGRGVAATAPVAGQVLKYNGSQWAPAADDGGSSQWTTSGANIHYNLGNVGIGDATPAATLTVGDGDKFQVFGAEGDVVFTDDNATIRFPATTLPNSPMLQMFSSGTQNADRMVISHSPGFPTWGIEYKDSVDALFFRDASQRRFTFELGTGQMGFGNTDPAFPIDLNGRMRLRSTGSLSNSPGIWFQNNAGTFDRAFFGMSEPDSVIGIFSQHLGKWAIEFEVMREPRIGVNIPVGSPPRAEIHLYHTNFGGSNDGIRIQNEGSNDHYWNLYTSNTTGDFEFFKQGIKRATINQASGAYTAISDARLKTQVASLGSVLPNVMQLQAKTYKYIGHENDKTFSGFLAQDLEPLFPQFVFFGGDDQKYYTVDYAGMSVVALKAIQEQQGQIEQQRSEIEALRAELDQLKAAVQALQAAKP